MTITYVGERLLPGQIGNFFVVLGFVSVLFSSSCYFISAGDSLLSASWKKLGRLGFLVHGLSVFGVVGTLFYMLYNHFYEYEYVWHHSSNDMRMRYIFSCFWEGQEGSFLLWSFWNVVLGFILMRTSKLWESSVMSVFTLAQAFLASMTLGIYVFNYKIGSNPFTVLLRQHPDFSGIPLFQNPNYLSKLDGRGLNPLLQNYWMTIHPPTLFLGFALTLVPFAYAVAGLWKNKSHNWQRPALPWAFTGIAILGTGILMGGAWAYEALSFGGFWAWDPVENSSLVPWLTLVGSAHVMLIHKNKGQSLFTCFLLTFLSYILVLYSTFLTRSGILGESSVHAFTDLGMSGQLLLYLFFFLLLSAGLLVYRRSAFKHNEAEEDLWSREFWMFIGSLVLLIASFHILFNTSLPVWNKLFHLKMAAPTNAIEFYNAWQIPFAILICVFMAFTQFLKYKQSDVMGVAKKLLLPLLISLALTAVIALGLKLYQVFYVLLLWAALFSFIGNFDYALLVFKGKISRAGASIAHIGFALVLLGALISTSKKDFISVDQSGKDLRSLDKQLSSSQNILLQKGDTVQMGDYYVSYVGKHKVGPNILFETAYFTKLIDGKFKPEFILNPLVQTNPRMGNVAEPDTRHFWDKDIYTHITYADLSVLEKTSDSSEYGASKTISISQRDTGACSRSLIVLKGLNSNFNRKLYDLSDSAVAIEADLSFIDLNKKSYVAHPVYAIVNNRVKTFPAEVKALGVKIDFLKINTENGKIDFAIQEKSGGKRDFIVMEAIVFRYITILWIGCVVMVIGTIISIIQRIRRSVNEK